MGVEAQGRRPYRVEAGSPSWALIRRKVASPCPDRLPLQDGEPIEQEDAGPLCRVRQLLLKQCVQLVDHGIEERRDQCFMSRLPPPAGSGGAFTPLNQTRVREEPATLPGSD